MSLPTGEVGAGGSLLPPSVLPGDEEAQLREVVRDLLAREAPPEPAEFAAGDRRARLWRMAAELGWSAIAIDEDHDGLGLGFLAQVGLLEEAGKGLFPGPLTTAAAATAILAASRAGDDRDAALAAIAAGAVASFALAPGGDDGCLAGEAEWVPDADLAAAFVLVAAVEGVPGAFLLGADAVVAEPVAAIADRGRPLFSLRFDPGAARALGAAPGGVDLARAVLGAELVGTAERALEVTVEHVRDREQFGRPLGAFQAVKHQLADVYVANQRARSLVRGALAGNPLERPPGEFAREAAMAKAAASEAALGAVRTGIQLTGALGTTAEHPLPWLLGRARSGAALLGNAAELYAAIGREARGADRG
ncbi:MAG TPA: acyl-CoA dehydrogenase family protein [Solirubrobacterales bacterium]|jgi:alkylation response protein AidB-like acyl-CoA dehydrogenase|nr:acyl-CoA dehydrogenase family protein [Solirubrobacterales bacterium]